MSQRPASVEVSGPRRLPPHLARARRGPAAIQFGSSPGGVVVDGMDAEDIRLLDRLARGASAAALASEARRRGGDTARGRRLMAALDAAGLLVGAEPVTTPEATRLRAEHWSWHAAVGRERAGAVRERPARAVRIDGVGGLAIAVASGFAAAGVGVVSVTGTAPVTASDVVPGGPLTGDIGRPTTEAAAAAVRRVAPRVRTSLRPRSDLVVLVGAHAHDASAAARWLASDVAHLAVAVRDGDVLVGPAVLPGIGPCLHCLDLTRRDRDPAWPAVVEQFVRTGRVCATSPVPALAQSAAGLAVLLGLAVLDGEGAAVCGVTATVSLPLAHVDWRRWHPHPECGCTDGPGRAPLATDDTIVP